jgi:hypothetical protein
VGVKREGRLKCRLVVGKADDYRETQALSLVRASE